MKIAVATKDGKQIASIRSSPIFRIYQIINGKIRENSTCLNSYTYRYVKTNDHRENMNDSGVQGYIDGDRDGSMKKRTSVINIIRELEDCSVVIFRNIGKDAWNTLGLLGKEMILTDVKDVEKAVRMYLKGNLIDKYLIYH